MNTSILWLDTFLFNGDEVCFTRLAYLYKHVDMFYICEKRYTYQGKRKEVLYIDSMKDRFTPYLDKLVFLVDDTPTLEDAWKNETTHRNFAVQALLRDYPDTKYIVTVCDCDEIPDASVVVSQKEALYTATHTAAVYMQQDLYYYNLHWYICNWTRAFILNDVLLRSIQSFQMFRDMRWSITQIIICGWHLSYCMTVDQIVTKYESFSHAELNTDESKNKEHILNSIIHGPDYRKTDGAKLVKRNVDANEFPPEILQFHYDIMKRQV